VVPDQDEIHGLGCNVCGQDCPFLEKAQTRDQMLGKVCELLDSPLLPPPHLAFSRDP